MSAITVAEKPLPSIYDLYPPHGAITDNYHGAYVVIMSWIMMSFFSLSVITRILTRFVPVRVYGADDLFIALSMVFATAQTAVIHVSASNGMGQHLQTLSPMSSDTFSKALYASDMLFMMSIYLAKVSLVLFIMRLTPSRKALLPCYSFVAAITFWMLGTVFSLAFRCPFPHPWNFMPIVTAECGINTKALYISISAVDVVTDLAIVAAPAIIIWDVQISRRQRYTVIGVFGSRLAVCICSSLLLASLPPFANSSDPSWAVVTPQIWRQVVQCLSIITACIPCLRPFLASLESGFMDSSMHRVIGRTYGVGSGHEAGGDNKIRDSTCLALTSFAAGSGGNAIIIPCDPPTRSKQDVENRAPGQKLRRKDTFVTRILPSRSTATRVTLPHQPRGDELCEAPGKKNCYPKTYNLATATTSSLVACYHHHHQPGPHFSEASIAAGHCYSCCSSSKRHHHLQSSDSVNRISSRKNCQSPAPSPPPLHGRLKRLVVEPGRIRETREVVISVERGEDTGDANKVVTW